MKVIKHSEREKAIIKASIKERILFQEFQNYLPEIEITNISKVESKEYWDVCFTSGTTNYLCEIKCRKYSKDAFDEGWILETKKLDRLQELIATPRAKQNNLKAMYCNFFTDGILFFDVTTMTKENAVVNNYKRISVDPSAGTTKKTNLKLKNNTAVAKYDWDISYPKFDADAEIIYDFLFPTTKTMLK